jgi:hypothetical protein
MNTLKKLSLFLVALSVMLSVLGAAASPAAAAPSEAATCKLWHTVQKGEYLSRIAWIYETDWRKIAEINELQNPSKIYTGQKLCIFTTASGGSSTPAPVVIPDTGYSQRVYASSVREDRYATLVGKNLVANMRYSVYLSRIGVHSTQSILVGSVYTDKYGAFTGTFNLPKKLVDRAKIYIYLTNGRGDSVTNWFINATAKGSTGGVGMAAISLKVTEVKKSQVQIKATNLPANVPFSVYIGKAGSKGIGGTKVGVIMDDDGGGVKGAFDIPSSMVDRSKLDIRLEYKPLGISTYLTFEN